MRLDLNIIYSILNLFDMMNFKSNGFKKSFPGGALVVNGCQSDDVASAMIEKGKQKEPFHIFDMDVAYCHMQYFKKSMPRVQIFFAMKANDHDMLLKLAVSQGCGFDCASPGEIKKILQLGVHPRSIIFAVPSKNIDHIVYAREARVMHATFDTSNELKKLKQFWPDVRLLLRIKVESDSIYKLGEKFGCDPENEAFELLEEAAALGLQVVGIAFHVGSACFSPESYATALYHVHKIFEHEAKSGRKLTIVDIGGGFLSQTIHEIDGISKIVNSAITKYFSDPSIQIIAEPGRYLCDSAYKLYCNINNVRQVKRNQELINLLYITDGVHGTLGRSEPWHTVRKFQLSSNQNNDDEKILEKAVIYGPSCDYEDRIMRNLEVRLPRCEPQDWLVFTYQGSYTINFASRFCNLEIPLIRSIVSQDLWNKLKCNEVFDTDDFIVDADVSSPLPSTLPSLPEKIEKNVKSTPLLQL